MIKHTKNSGTKYTQGPWNAVYRPSMNLAGVHIKASSNYLEVGYCNSSDNETPEADARLIAAAPELLRELKSALFYIETYGGEVTSNFSSGGNLDAVKAIIAKAEGEPK